MQTFFKKYIFYIIFKNTFTEVGNSEHNGMTFNYKKPLRHLLRL